MTASVQALVPISAPTPRTPISLPAKDFRDALTAGAVAVDVRSQRRRAADGALLGALAIDAAEVLDALTPGTPASLRRAHADARWILVSDDGHEAEWLAWHLQAAGVTGAVFLLGGFRRLRRAGINGPVNPDELAMFSAH
ncbi:MAG: rhodanese-like domain-containing protein [Gordonia sp. (in: high G+C Gram-positive bacteria)]